MCSPFFSSRATQSEIRDSLFVPPFKHSSIFSLYQFTIYNYTFVIKVVSGLMNLRVKFVYDA